LNLLKCICSYSLNIFEVVVGGLRRGVDQQWLLSAVCAWRVLSLNLLGNLPLFLLHLLQVVEALGALGLQVVHGVVGGVLHEISVFVLDEFVGRFDH